MQKNKLLNALNIPVTADFYASLAHVTKNKKSVKQICPSVLQECTGTQSRQIFFKTAQNYTLCNRMYGKNNA